MNQKRPGVRPFALYGIRRDIREVCFVIRPDSGYRHKKSRMSGASLRYRLIWHVILARNNLRNIKMLMLGVIFFLYTGVVNAIQKLLVL
jgi:hypothetical protein